MSTTIAAPRVRQKPREFPWHKVRLALTAVMLLLLAAWAAWFGVSYYTTPIPERPFHPLHAEFRPSGRIGIRLGLVAVLALLTLSLFPAHDVHDVPRIRQGVVAPEDVIAPMDFPVLRTKEDLARQQEVAALSVPPVYRVNFSAADSALARIERYLTRVETIAGEEPSALESLDRVDGARLGQ